MACEYSGPHGASLGPWRDSSDNHFGRYFDELRCAWPTMRVHLLSLLVLPFMASASMDEQVVLPSSQASSGQPFVPVIHSGKPSLADLLTIESSASIFYSYARELELSEKFSDAAEHLTVLVPTNKAVIALPRKP